MPHLVFLEWTSVTVMCVLYFYVHTNIDRLRLL